MPEVTDAECERFVAALRRMPGMQDFARDLIAQGDELRERLAATEAEHKRLRNDYERQTRNLANKQNEATAMAHVILEGGIDPGISPSPCRCDECRLVATRMDEAGYLSNVKDRWWRGVDTTQQPGDGVEE